jgi:hypothetical protein
MILLEGIKTTTAQNLLLNYYISIKIASTMRENKPILRRQGDISVWPIFLARKWSVSDLTMGDCVRFMRYHK